MIPTLLLAFAAASPAPVDRPRTPASVPADTTLRNAIAGLGGDQSWRNIDEIAAYGCKAVPHLVRELRMLRPGRYLPGETRFASEHIFYVFAALRRVTEHDFYGAATRRQLAAYSEEGRYFLRQSAPAGKVKPFGLWMSHGIFYVAPASAQQEILRAWRHYSASGACRRSSPPPDRMETDYLTGHLT